MEGGAWQVLVLDADGARRSAVEAVVSGLRFADRSIVARHAEDEAAARALLSAPGGCDLAILNVVSGTDDPGLNIARYIRRDLQKADVQILTRLAATLNIAPQVIIRDYDIDDAWVFDEDTDSRLAPAVVASLRRAQRQRDDADRYRILKEAYDRLQQAKPDLLELEKLAGLASMVGAVAHELNTPIGISVTGVSLLSDKRKVLDQHLESGKLKRSELQTFLDLEKETIQLLTTNLTRAADLVQSFKQVSIDQASGERRTFPLCQYLREIMISLGPRLKKTRHEVVLDCTNSIEMDTYPGALSQIVTNLVVNSLVHGFDEGQAGTLRLDVAPAPDGRVAITYSDDGKGIPEGDLPHIFEAFFTTKRSSGGSGLGLNIVKKLVEESLHGEIAVSSTPGAGVTFTMTLPCVLPGGV